MRTIITELWPPKTSRDDLKEGVFLNLESAPDLAGLTEGERVILLEPHELRAEGVVHRVEDVIGRIWWFAEFASEIEVIDEPQE